MIGIQKVKQIAREAGREVRELEKTGIPILSEESENDKICLKSDKIWIVDPLDGTSDFVQQTGKF